MAETEARVGADSGSSSSVPGEGAGSGLPRRLGFPDGVRPLGSLSQRAFDQEGMGGRQHREPAALARPGFSRFLVQRADPAEQKDVLGPRRRNVEQPLGFLFQGTLLQGPVPEHGLGRRGFVPGKGGRHAHEGDGGDQGAALPVSPARIVEAHHGHDREFESLGGVDRHDPDDVLVLGHEVRFLGREGLPQGARQGGRARREARAPGGGELPRQGRGPGQVGRHAGPVRGRGGLQRRRVFQQGLEHGGGPRQEGRGAQLPEALRRERELALEPRPERRVSLFGNAGQAQGFLLAKAGEGGNQPPAEGEPVVRLGQGPEQADEIEDLSAGEEPLALLEDGGDAGGLEGLLQGGIVRASRHEDRHVAPLQRAQGAAFLVPGELPAKGGQLRRQAPGQAAAHGGLLLFFLRLGVLPVGLEQEGNRGGFQGVAPLPPGGVGRSHEGFVVHPEGAPQPVRPQGAEAAVHEPDQVLPHPVAPVQEDVAFPVSAPPPGGSGRRKATARRGGTGRWTASGRPP